MVWLGFDRGVERGPPVVVRLTWGAVDEVKADVLEPGGLRLGDPPRRRAGSVHAIEHREDVRTDRLHAEADAGEAGVPKGLERPGIDRLRIRFGRHLRVAGKTKEFADGGQHRREVGRRQQGRRASPEEHGLDGQVGVAEHAARELQFGDRVARVGRLSRAAAELGRPCRC